MIVTVVCEESAQNSACAHMFAMASPYAGVTHIDQLAIGHFGCAMATSLVAAPTRDCVYRKALSVRRRATCPNGRRSDVEIENSIRISDRSDWFD